MGKVKCTACDSLAETPAGKENGSKIRATPAKWVGKLERSP